jgi:hypothetical protein
MSVMNPGPGGYVPPEFGYSQFDYGFDNILNSRGQTSNIAGTLPAQLGQGAIGAQNFDFMQNYGAPLGANSGAPTGFGNAYNTFMGKYGQSIGQGISAAGALFNLYAGIKSLGLMQKQFDLAKKTTRIGINNQATAYNNEAGHHQQAVANRTRDLGLENRGFDFKPMQGFGS